MSIDNIIVLPREDVAALMAAIADLEQIADALDAEAAEAVATLSRIASNVDEQVSTQ